MADGVDPVIKPSLHAMAANVCRFGVTEEVHKMRAAHADQYTKFIRAGRTAAAHKYLTRPEGGEGDINMGMQPYRCGCDTPQLCLQSCLQSGDIYSGAQLCIQFAGIM